MDANDFLRDVAKHQMTIDYDNGFNRRIVFANPADCNRWFELITWREHLCFSGDMGTFVFRRVDDMFSFFRRDDLSVNTGYWHEKLQAVDRIDGSLYYSEDIFKHTVKERFDDWADEDELSDEVKAEAWAEVEDEILSRGEYECDARYAVEDFKSSYGFEITNFWETRLTDYTGRYLWCLYAIVWGIQQYDKNKGG